MFNNKNRCACATVLLSVLFWSLTAYAQENCKISIYEDEHVQFLQPAGFCSVPAAANPFQICLTDNAGARIYFAVSQKKAVNANKDIFAGEETTAANKAIPADNTLLISDYGSKLLGMHGQKIDWVQLQRQRTPNNYLILYFWRNVEKQYLFLFEGPKIKMDAIIKEAEENIIFLKAENKK